MSLTAKQKHDLKKLINELEQYRGAHTELVSVYIPAGYDMNKIVNHLAQEQGTATNIKSASTRKNVIDALERMIQHLKLFDRTPEHGLAVFSGNIAAKEGKSDVRVWSVEPPSPLKTRIYRCDKQFLLDILRDQLEVKDVYGMIVMDRREGIIAFLKGKTIVPLTRSTSNVPGKTRAGGQSAHRFERIREGAALEFFRRLAEHAKEEFFGNKNLKGIIVGGPGPTKYDFIEQLPTELRNKILAVKDLSYTDEFGLQELLDKSNDVLAAEEVIAEKKLLARFFELLSTRPNMVSYGEAEVRRVIELGAVDILLLSEDIDDKKLEELEGVAKQFGTKVEIISTETREGVQLRDIGKVAAILRYEVSQ